LTAVHYLGDDITTSCYSLYFHHQEKPERVCFTTSIHTSLSFVFKQNALLANQNSSFLLQSFPATIDINRPRTSWYGSEMTWIC